MEKLTKFKRLFSTSTIDPGEVHHFQKLVNEWWNEFGTMKALHSMNKLRVPLIRNSLTVTNKISPNKVNTCKPLENIEILDVGCGGGILCEPLARLGATVTGIDATSNLIQLAEVHSKQQNLTIKYVESSVEQHADNNQEKYDLVVASEILEHVTKKETFLEACVKCLKPNGSIILSTINKTLAAQLGAVVFSEYLINFVPKGTHEYDKFVEPHKVQRILELNDCRTQLIHGMFYNFLTNKWEWCSSTAINYALHAIKLK